VEGKRRGRDGFGADDDVKKELLGGSQTARHCWARGDWLDGAVLIGCFAGGIWGSGEPAIEN
jgi:hypothetical protein